METTRWLRWPLLLLAAVLSVAAPVRSQATRPRLIVLLVVDQMRADYIDRLSGQWTSGFRRLLTNGAWFRHIDYPYFDTLTCPSHATLSSGTLPSTHGMVLHVWWDPRKKREVRCTQDDAATFVSYGRPVPGTADSAANLRVPTLADELRERSGSPGRVIALSLKARSAIGLGGHKPDVVTWFDDSGTWVTSTAFSKGPVPPVADFIRQHPVEGPDYDAWQTSPRSDEYLSQMAMDVATRMRFDAATATNMIGIGFSALDRVGHAFGPDSSEVEETLAHLDRTLGVLLDGLDGLVGEGNYTVALTADHGVAPVPEQISARGADAGRVTPAQFTEQIEGVFRSVLGRGRYVAHVVSTHVYLNPGVVGRVKKSNRLDAVRARIRALPFVADVYWQDDIRAADPHGDTTLSAIARSNDPQRSGDLTIVLRPNWIAYAGATTHGTAYDYDTRVPLLLMGAGIRPGQYLQPASPLDIAPTLAFLAGVTLPHAEGRVLREALFVTSAAPYVSRAFTTGR